MTFKRPYSVFYVPNSTNDDEDRKRFKSSRKLSTCQVCGDEAHIINYGALSCQSCKTFFRRNGFHPENVRPCFFNGSCNISIYTRRNCTACRFAKCLMVGMSPELIRKEIQHNKKCTLSTDIRVHQNDTRKPHTSSSQSSIFGLFCNDEPPLNDSEWILLSNVIHAHGMFNAIPEICRIVKKLTASLFVSPPDTMSELFKVIILMYSSMKSFIYSSPDFRILAIDEQYSLCERNLHCIVALCSVYFFRAAGIADNSRFAGIFTILYGSEIILRAKHTDEQSDPDLTIIKMMLIVLAFSSNCSNIVEKEESLRDSLLNGTFRLFGSQSAYVEVLWKYMIHRYGHYNSVLRMSRINTLVLNLIKYSSFAYATNEIYHHLINHIFAQIKQSLIIEQYTLKPLWGKL